jgi:hypothetical protein
MSRKNDLGDLSKGMGQPRKLPTFVWFGERRRIHPGVTELSLTDFFEKAESIDLGDSGYDPNDPETWTPEVTDKIRKALPMVKDLVREMVHPDDFEEVWRVGREAGVDSTGFMSLSMSIITGVTDRPTGPQPVSSSGQRRTSRKSGGDFYSRAIKHKEKEGRGDLAQAVVLSRNAAAKKRVSA